MFDERVDSGPGVSARLADARFLDRIAQIHATTTWTVGICNGVALLVAAGILDDVSVTTNDA